MSEKEGPRIPMTPQRRLATALLGTNRVLEAHEELTIEGWAELLRSLPAVQQRFLLERFNWERALNRQELEERMGGAINVIAMEREVLAALRPRYEAICLSRLLSAARATRQRQPREVTLELLFPDSIQIPGAVGVRVFPEHRLVRAKLRHHLHVNNALELSKCKECDFQGTELRPLLSKVKEALARHGLELVREVA